MSFIDSIRTTIDSLFVPRDGLYDQAKALIAQHDPDGNGRIELAGLQAQGVVAADGLEGGAARSFLAADKLGNGNGVTTLREVRAMLEKFDGQAGGSARDGVLDGTELLALESTFTTPASTGAPSGAAAGSAQLGAVPSAAAPTHDPAVAPSSAAAPAAASDLPATSGMPPKPVV